MGIRLIRSRQGDWISSIELGSVPIREDLIPTLEALVARIVLADQDPGARELGAVAFIQDRIEDSPELLPVYESGLKNLANLGFLNLSELAQDEALQEVEKQLPEFFSLATTHCIEAVYVDPKGLKMVGFEVTA